MIYVLDASVAVAAVRPGEAHHAAARSRVAGLLAADDDVVVPSIFDIEVVSALVRNGVSAVLATAYLDREFSRRRLVTLGPRAARSIIAVVAATKLRAADAAYVWVAMKKGLPLVTLDQEVGKKASGLCRVEAP